MCSISGPQRLTFIHNAKSNWSLSQSPQSFNHSIFVQKSNFNVSPKIQSQVNCKLLYNQDLHKEHGTLWTHGVLFQGLAAASMPSAEQVSHAVCSLAWQEFWGLASLASLQFWLYSYSSTHHPDRATCRNSHAVQHTAWPPSPFSECWLSLVYLLTLVFCCL